MSRKAVAEKTHKIRKNGTSTTFPLPFAYSVPFEATLSPDTGLEVTKILESPSETFSIPPEWQISS
jgi:hypothetical protein